MNILSSSEIELSPETRLVVSSRKETLPDSKPKSVKKALKNVNFQFGLPLYENGKHSVCLLNNADYKENYYLPACLKSSFGNEPFAFIFAISDGLCVIVYDSDGLVISEIYLGDYEEVADAILDTVSVDTEIYTNRQAKEMLNDIEGWDSIFLFENINWITQENVENALSSSYLFASRDSVLPSEGSNRSTLILVLAPVAFLIVGLASYFYFSKEEKVKDDSNVVIVDNYADYKLALQNPNVDRLFDRVLESYNTLNDLNGWAVDQLNLEGLQVDLVLSNIGTDYTTLINNPALNDFMLSQDSGFLIARKALALDSYNDFEGIMEAVDASLFIKDKSLKLRTLAVQSQLQDFGNWKKVSLDIPVDNISLDEIKRFLKEISALPVVLTKFDLKRETLLWSGTITLDVLGE